MTTPAPPGAPPPQPAPKGTWLLYGPPGSSKSTMAYQIAEFCPQGAVVIDVDHKAEEMVHIRPLVESGRLRIVPVKSRLSEEGFKARILHPDRPPQIQPKGWLEFANVLSDIDKPGQPPYDVLIIDSLTRAVEHLTRLISFVNKHPVLAERDWGYYLTQLEELIQGVTSQLRDKAVIFIAHDMNAYVEDAEGNARQSGVRVLVSGQMKDKIGQYFGEVYHFEPLASTKDVLYRIRTRGDRNWPARTSRPHLALFEVSDSNSEVAWRPTWEKILGTKPLKGGGEQGGKAQH